jgi:glycosyltransferase involved in cell wall biosynthesis/SAM-dependent methyltransferase
MEGYWLDSYFVQNDGDGPFSFLEIGCADGLRLQKALTAGAQCFAAESDPRQLEAVRRLCPDAYIVAGVEDIPPHAFDLILISPLDDTGTLRTCLYKLAAMNAFKPTTALIAMAGDATKAAEAAATLSLLRFGKVEIAESGPYRAEGRGSDFAQFMQERYVPGTWSEIAAYEHLPRYQFAGGMAQDARVLDFGCGSGYGTAMLARTAAAVKGLDISEDALAYARMIHQAVNLEFVRDDAFGASLPAHTFELITCFEVIEHLDSQNQDELLVALKRLLAPNGRLLISTPNPHTTSLYGKNPYHLCELSRDQFAEKLRQHFSEVALLDQWVTANIAFQPDADHAWGRLHDLARDGDISQAAPAIFVGICAMEPIGELTATIYTDRTRDFVQTRIQSLQWRNQQLIELYELQQVRREVRRLNYSITQNATQLRDMTAEFEAVLADRSILQATHAATEAALKKSRQETEKAYLERNEFRNLTEELNATLADMETRATAELVEMQKKTDATQARSQTVLAEARARTTAELAEMRARAAEDTAQAQTKIANHILQIEALATKLRLIEQSTSWRVAKRLMPLMQVARPVLRPPAVALWRLKRRAAWPNRKKDDPSPSHPLFQPASEQQRSVQAPRDLVTETSIDPVWDPAQRKYVLQFDPSFIPTPQSHELVQPYTVRVIGDIDHSIIRPKILHVIPNVHVGGSTQLVIDLVQRLSVEFRHEVLTSSLWKGKPHNGLTTHLVAHADQVEMGTVIDRVAPDLIHFHYWGLTDDPWYHSALAIIKEKNIPSLQNVNTPIPPICDKIFRHYVFVSEYVRREFSKGLPTTAGVSVIYPGIEMQRFERVEPAADRGQSMGMVYRLEDDKLTETAIDVFIEIVRIRPRTKIYIIGGGRFLEPYIARTEEAGVRANFRFAGYVPYTSLPGWYNKFAVFVAPVWKESFGQVAPFAMIKRQAVVGFKIGALPEILGDDATLGENITDTAKIATALLDDPKRLRQLGDRNEARAREMFAVETMISRYREVYTTLIDMPVDGR